jgi:hypothetical protein
MCVFNEVLACVGLALAQTFSFLLPFPSCLYSNILPVALDIKNARPHTRSHARLVLHTRATPLWLLLSLFLFRVRSHSTLAPTLFNSLDCSNKRPLYASICQSPGTLKVTGLDVKTTISGNTVPVICIVYKKVGASVTAICVRRRAPIRPPGTTASSEARAKIHTAFAAACLL